MSVYRFGRQVAVAYSGTPPACGGNVSTVPGPLPANVFALQVRVLKGAGRASVATPSPSKRACARLETF